MMVNVVYVVIRLMKQSNPMKHQAEFLQPAQLYATTPKDKSSQLRYI